MCGLAHPSCRCSVPPLSGWRVGVARSVMLHVHAHSPRTHRPSRSDAAAAAPHLKDMLLLPVGKAVRLVFEEERPAPGARGPGGVAAWTGAPCFRPRTLLRLSDAGLKQLLLWLSRVEHTRAPFEPAPPRHLSFATSLGVLASAGRFASSMKRSQRASIPLATAGRGRKGYTTWPRAVRPPSPARPAGSRPARPASPGTKWVPQWVPQMRRGGAAASALGDGWLPDGQYLY